MTSVENNGRPIRVNYQAPLWATILSSLLLLLVSGFLGIIGIGGLLNAIGIERDYITAVFCGLFEVMMFAGVAFFGYALYKAGRDLLTPLQLATGVVVDNLAHQRMGGGAYWLVIDTDPSTDEVVAERVGRYIPLSASSANPPTHDNTRRVFGSAAEPAPVTVAATNTAAANRSANEADIFARNERLMRPTIVRFRVDKPVYQLLHLNDRVTVAYSRHLEHVYYVQQWQGSSGVVLYNRSLL